LYSWQWFSPILWRASSIWWPFFLLCGSFFISWSPFCQSSLSVAEPFEFYLGSHRLCLLIPVYSVLFPALALKYRSYIKVLNSLWSDTCTGWKTWI
jgi:hypothetical protein